MRCVRSVVPLLIPLFAFCLFAASVRAQTTAPLTIVMPDGEETVLAATAIAALPRETGRASAHGQEFTYAGAELRAVLKLAGLQTDSLRGPLLRRVIKIVASDGYTVVLALSDLDPSIGARRVLLIDTEDGKPLSTEYAPRRLLVLGDVRPTRWARQVVRIVVSDLP